mgnify:CR=1
MREKLTILAITAVLLLGTLPGQARNSSAKDSPGESEAQKGEKATVMLTKETFLKEVWDYENSPQEWKFKGDKPALIDFYADWCAPCRKAAPVLEEIASEYQGKIDVYKIDTQKERELAAVFQVRGIPAFLYIPLEGKPTMTSGIGRSDEETKQRFEEIINKVLLTSN